MKNIILAIFTIVLLSCGPDIKEPRTGSEGVLDGETATIVVSDSQEAYGEFRQTLRANDMHGTANLLRAGKIFSVKKGTRILVIDEDPYMKKVRVIEGNRAGMAGWVPVERVAKTR